MAEGREQPQGARDGDDRGDGRPQESPRGGSQGSRSEYLSGSGALGEDPMGENPRGVTLRERDLREREANERDAVRAGVPGGGFREDGQGDLRQVMSGQHALEREREAERLRLPATEHARRPFGLGEGGIPRYEQYGGQQPVQVGVQEAATTTDLTAAVQGLMQLAMVESEERQAQREHDREEREARAERDANPRERDFHRLPKTAPKQIWIWAIMSDLSVRE